MATNLPFPGSRSGDQYQALAAAGTMTFQVSQDWLIEEIRFAPASGSAFAGTDTATLTIEGQSYCQGVPVPILLLQTAWAANVQAPANNGIVVWRPSTPVRFNKSFEVTIALSAAARVLIVTRPAGE